MKIKREGIKISLTSEKDRRVKQDKIHGGELLIETRDLAMDNPRGRDKRPVSELRIVTDLLKKSRT